MSRWHLRVLTIALAAVLAGVPVLAAVCDATCAETVQARRDASVPSAAHHHAARAGASTRTAVPAESDAHSHHHHADTAPADTAPAAAPATPDLILTSTTATGDCAAGSRIGAWSTTPRIDAGAKPTRQTAAMGAAIPPAESLVLYAAGSRHGPPAAHGSASLPPLVLRI